ncbi:alpha carbonic anhydrase 7-like [Iris pallida]|uniref:Carbonic anhydrase n=1 Tax=Iris pallida TaxID=29817 RepID=A0AAX6DU66_IRIPA|nr:alpha carbonic anhydrase 7-like [Iris pallida]KAJ6800999.1 alpha carbonic anhydrase 7-like [Iris pallida]
MGLNKLAIVSSTILLLFISSSLLVTSQEVEDEHEFNYDIEDEEHGPEKWGELHKEWAACGKGKLQSPIDLSDDRVDVQPHLGLLNRSYRPAAAILKNRGHDIMLRFDEDAGSTSINGTKYPLKQLHWHSPSEHTVNGRRYSLELHMVHQTADDKLAVVGILYKLGRPDPFLAEMEGYIKKLEGLVEKEEKVGTIDPRHIKRGSRKYYRYMGSLTVPPCTEGVVWTIVKKIRTVSRKQMNLLREAVHDDFNPNARPTQEMNDRTINFYRPKKLQY